MIGVVIAFLIAFQTDVAVDFMLLNTLLTVDFNVLNTLLTVFLMLFTTLLIVLLMLFQIDVTVTIRDFCLLDIHFLCKFADLRL